MAKTLAEMASKGKRKLTAKAPTMASNWDAAKSRMKASYGALPFGPTTKSAYNAGVDAGVYHVPDISKWERNWLAAVSR